MPWYIYSVPDKVVDCRPLVGKSGLTAARLYSLCVNTLSCSASPCQTLNDLKTLALLTVFFETCKTTRLHQIGIGDRQESDVLLIAPQGRVHAAIYLGNDKILHQRMDSISAVEPLRQYYWKRTVAAFRHATCQAGR